MKKLSTFLCLAGLLCLSSSVRAYNFQSGDLYYNITSNAEPYTAAVTYEKQYAKDNYAGISDLVIPETVENEGITYSVTSIRDYAFYQSAGLTSVTIPESVASIGEFAFTNCKALTAITVAPGNPTYDSRNNCNAIVETGTHTLRVGCSTTVIPESVTSIGDYAFYQCTGLASITIPKSVTSIEKNAFNCSGLTSVTIPEGVTSIGYNAFSDCRALTTITVAPGNPTYDSRNNCNAIVETGTNTLHIGCNTTVIPEGVTSIGDDAFYACTGLTSITIPEDVTSIGDYAFAYCTGLTSVTIPEGVTSIGDKAFSHCTGLTSVTIPEGVASIGDMAFNSCTGIETIISYAATPPACGMYTFDQVPAEANVYVPCDAVEAYKSDATWSQFTGIRCIEDIPSAMEHTDAEPAAVQKTVLEGKVVILREGKTYDLLGREVR